MLRIINVVLGYPLGNPGHNCVMVDPAVQYFWQNALCSKKLGYICYVNADEERLLTQGKALLLLKQYVAGKTSATTHQRPFWFQSCCCRYCSSRDRLLFDSLDSLQRPLLSTHPDSENVVWCSKTMSENRRRPGQRPQYRRPELFNLSIRIRYVTDTFNRI